MEWQAESSVLWSRHCRGGILASKCTDSPHVPYHNNENTEYVYKILQLHGHKRLKTVLEMP